MQERARNKIEYYLILLSSRENQSFYEIKCNTLSFPLAANNFFTKQKSFIINVNGYNFEMSAFDPQWQVIPELNSLHK